MARARILLADDHREIRDRVVNLLEPEFEILEPVADGRALLERAAELNPDVCLVDISMPIIDGIEAAGRLKENGSTAKIIFLTIHGDQILCRQHLKQEPQDTLSSQESCRI